MESFSVVIAYMVNKIYQFIFYYLPLNQLLEIWDRFSSFDPNFSVFFLEFDFQNINTAMAYKFIFKKTIENEFENYNKEIPGCLKFLEYNMNFLAWQSLTLLANKIAKNEAIMNFLKPHILLRKEINAFLRNQMTILEWPWT